MSKKSHSIEKDPYRRRRVKLFPASLTEWLYPGHTFRSGYSIHDLANYPDGLIRYDDYLARERNRINDNGGSVRISKVRGRWALVKARDSSR